MNEMRDRDAHSGSQEGRHLENVSRIGRVCENSVGAFDLAHANGKYLNWLTAETVRPEATRSMNGVFTRPVGEKKTASTGVTAVARVPFGR
jgi:hypothetical protein